MSHINARRPEVERTCRWCERPFASILARKLHEKNEHPAETIAPRPVLSEHDLALLGTVKKMQQVVIRGADTAELGAALGITPRAVRFRLQRLRQKNLIVSDADGGIVLTDDGKTVAANARKKGLL